jgi:hypothetical protein
MRLHFTTDWLRMKIAEDTDIECEAGIPLLDASVLERFVRAPERKSAVLNVLVHQLRNLQVEFRWTLQKSRQSKQTSITCRGQERSTS